MNQILCSTGALIGIPNGRDYRLLEKLSGKLNCDGYEFMMYSSWYGKEEEIADFLKQSGLNIPVMHCEKHIGECISRNEEGDLTEAIWKFRKNCEVARKIGARKLVIHLWDGQISDQHFPNNLRAYRELETVAEEYGIDLLVENVVCNQRDPMAHWCELAEAYPNVQFIFDTKMAAFHEQLPLVYEKEYEWLWEQQKIRHLHINDYGGGYMEWAKLRTLPLGEGHIDFGEFFRFIKKKNYSGDFTVEATAFDRNTGEVDTIMLNRCFDTIRSFYKGY